MKIDFSKPILSIDDTPMLEREGGPVATLCFLAWTALVNVDAEVTSPMSPPRQFTGGEKAGNAMLAHRILHSKEPVELEVEDLATIKKVVGQFHAPVAVMRAWNILEGKD